MKKTRGFLAALAVAFAGAGMYTTTAGAVATQYWINDPSAGTATNCDILVTNACPVGTRIQCSSSSAGSQLVFKTESAGACAVHLKP